MRGGYLHNQVLIVRLDERFRQAGAVTRLETAVRVGGSIGFVDLLAEFSDRRIVVEAERSARRIAGDIAKAVALSADELWIVVPEVRLRNSIRHRVVQLGVRENDARVCVLTLGQALQRVSDCFPLIAMSNACRQTAINCREQRKSPQDLATERRSDSCK